MSAPARSEPRRALNVSQFSLQAMWFVRAGSLYYSRLHMAMKTMAMSCSAFQCWSEQQPTQCSLNRLARLLQVRSSGRIPVRLGFFVWQAHSAGRKRDTGRAVGRVEAKEELPPAYKSVFGKIKNRRFLGRMCLVRISVRRYQRPFLTVCAAVGHLDKVCPVIQH